MTASDTAAFEAADQNQRTRILIQLTQAGYIDTADMMLHRYPLQGPTALNRTLFLEGVILEKRGDNRGAAAKFRSALANDPQLTLVRAELAYVLARMNETESAKHHLMLLRGAIDDPETRAGVQSFINSLDASRPFHFSGYVSLAPSTNINQGSSHDTVYSPGLGGVDGLDPVGTISPNSRKQSGVGISAGGSVGYVRPIGRSMQAVFAAGASSTYYPMVNETSFGLSQSAELRWLNPNGYFGAGAVAQEGVDPRTVSVNYKAYGPRVSMLRQISPRDQLSADITYQWRDYGTGSAANGTSLSFSSIWTHALDAGSNIAFLVGVDRVEQQLDFNSYRDGSIGAGFYKEMRHGLTVEGQASARYALFNAENPFTSTTRQDTALTGSLTFTKRDWNWAGFAPSLNYTYLRNFSNISLYDYDSHALDFRLTKDF